MIEHQFLFLGNLLIFHASNINGDTLFQAKNTLEWANAARQGKPACCYTNFNEKEGLNTNNRILHVQGDRHSRECLLNTWALIPESHEKRTQISKNL